MSPASNPRGSCIGTRRNYTPKMIHIGLFPGPIHMKPWAPQLYGEQPNVCGQTRPRNVHRHWWTASSKVKPQREQHTMTMRSHLQIHIEEERKNKEAKEANHDQTRGKDWGRNARKKRKSVEESWCPTYCCSITILWLLFLFFLVLSFFHWVTTIKRWSTTLFGRPYRTLLHSPPCPSKSSQIYTLFPTYPFCFFVFVLIFFTIFMFSFLYMVEQSIYI